MVSRKEKEFYTAKKLSGKLRNTIELSFKKVIKTTKEW